MVEKKQKTLPAADIGPKLQCLTRAGEKYVITQNPRTNKFTLWHVLSGGYEKLAVADSPMPLSDKVPW